MRACTGVLAPPAYVDTDMFDSSRHEFIEIRPRPKHFVVIACDRVPTLCPRPPTRACIVGSVRTKQLLVYVYYVVLPSVQLCCDLLDGDWCECLVCDSSGI